MPNWKGVAEMIEETGAWLFKKPETQIETHHNFFFKKEIEIELRRQFGFSLSTDFYEK